MSDGPPTYDVLIIGGGPAGTAAGLTLCQRPDLAVLVVESSDYQAPRIGESLSPGCRSLLHYLGVWDSFVCEQSLQTYGSEATWGTDQLAAFDYLLTIQGPGWSLDRLKFDHMLKRELVERGGRVLEQNVLQSCTREANGLWSVTLRGPTGTCRVNAKYLIDATGRRGFVSKQCGATRTVHDHLVGVASFVEGAPERAVVLVEATSYGWWYSAPIPGNRTAVVLMTDGDLAKRLDALDPKRWLSLLNETTITSERVGRVGNEVHHVEPRAFNASSSALVAPGGIGWVAVGDAACSHDPLSSSGIPHALSGGIQGALVATRALAADGHDEAALEAYSEGLALNYAKYLRTRWHYYRKEGRWSDSRFWKRRTTSVTLEPNAVLKSVNDQAPLQGVHMSAAQARALWSTCAPGRVAHELVGAYRQLHPEVSDERIILELQEMTQLSSGSTMASKAPF